MMSKAYTVLNLLDEFNVPNSSKYYRSEVEYRIKTSYQGDIKVTKKAVYIGEDINEASEALDSFEFPKKSFGCKKNLWHLADRRKFPRE